MADDSGFTLTSELPLEELPERRSSARQTKIEHIVNSMIKAGTTFWRDPEGKVYATIVETGRTSRYSIQSTEFKTMVRRINRGTTSGSGKPAVCVPIVSETEMMEALLIFEAIAPEDDVRRPDVRVVDYGGAFWYDLSCKEWRLIRVTAEKWTFVDQADVPLIRSRGMEAAPVPKYDPVALVNLRELLNIQNEDDFKFVVAWMVAALFPGGLTW